MDYHALGKRIREERLRLNLTQEKLAEEVGVSTAYIGQIERGERSLTLDKLVKVVNRLGVTIDFLLADYVIATDDTSMNLLIQLMHDRTPEEKTLAINILKVLFAKNKQESTGNTQIQGKISRCFSHVNEHELGQYLKGN